MTEWLQVTVDAVTSSTTYVDANYRKQWDNNLRAFQSKHHMSSKYNTAAYKFRSKRYRPKTRSAIRNNEAAAAAAFFTNKNVVSIEAENPANEVAKASAEFMQELLQYRLTKTIPWFTTLIGAVQDAQVVGVIASYQSWKYEERDGEVIRDEPDIEIQAVENIRIHPAADWRDPVNTSPYLLRMIPMYAIDVRMKMESKEWKEFTEGQLRSATKVEFDSTRMARDKDREDKFDTPDASDELADFDIVWVIENFVRDEHNRDQVYFTLGIEHILTEPVPIEEMYFTGKRPIVMGVGVIETHRLYPTAIAQLGENLQREINEVTNQRLDNVKLVLNKRYFVKRGSQVDLKSILRNVAGSITFVNNVHDDVRDFDFNDVTSSSYEEQSRLATEYDELVGNFSQSSVVNNRKLNETVGGMQMLKQESYGLTEYLIRTFSETWAKPVMEQMVQLEQKYETDFVIMAIAGEKAQLFQKYGMDQVTDELLSQRLTLEVNVGTGATDPVTKLNQFLLALTQYTNILKDLPPNAQFNLVAIREEIFGRLGFKDGARFFIDPEGATPQEQQLMQAIQEQQGVIQQLQGALNEKQTEQQVKLQTTAMKEDGMNIRKEAELETEIQTELIKLENPVPGEKVA